MPKRVSLQDVPDAQLNCMRGADGHSWQRIDGPRRFEGRWGWHMVKRCTECGKLKHIIHDANGNDASVSYEDPPGWVKITEPYDTADVRAEYIRRANRQSRSRGKHQPVKLRAV